MKNVLQLFPLLLFMFLFDSSGAITCFQCATGFELTTGFDCITKLPPSTQCLPEKYICSKREIFDGMARLQKTMRMCVTYHPGGSECKRDLINDNIQCNYYCDGDGCNAATEKKMSTTLIMLISVFTAIGLIIVV